MILFDTNVVSEFARPVVNASVLKWANAQPRDMMFLSAVSVAEIRLGLKLMASGRKRDMLEQAMRRIVAQKFAGRILPFDEAAADVYGARMAAARRSGRAVADLDGRVGAIALSRGLSVATRDVAPFQALGVAVINPWEAAP